MADTPAEWFAQINASNALDGLAATPALLGIQKALISGEPRLAGAIRGGGAKYGLPDKAEQDTTKASPAARR